MHACQHRGITRAILLGLLTCLVGGSAIADQWSFVGSRYQAMGGTGVAFADDSVAAYWNPSNLAWKRASDFQLPATISGDIENRAIEKITNLIEDYERIQNIIDTKVACSPCSGTPLTNGEAQEVLSWISQLSSFGQEAESVHVGLDLGLSGRVNNFGFSGLSLTTGTIYPNVDLDALGLATGVAALVGAGTTTVPNDVALRDQIVAGGGWTNDQANFLVLNAEQAGVDTTDPDNRSFFLDLASQTSGASGSSFANNQSGALVAGLSTQEFTFSYSHKIPMPYRDKMGPLTRVFDHFHNRIALGGNAKYMMGVSFIRKIRYVDGLSGGDIATEITEFSSRKISHNFSLDVGVSYRPFDFLFFGLTARNITNPSFDIEPFTNFEGRVVSEIEVPAQVRAGMAFVPIRNLTLAFDFDLTENTIVTLPGFTSRQISLGAEYAIPIGRKIDLALRLGGYNNVAGSVSQDWAMTGGVGLRLWQFILDASAGGSFASENVRTGATTYSRFPTRLSGGVTLKWEKSI